MFYDDGEYESIDEIAGGEGFFIDDDGNWVLLERAADYGIEIDDDDLLYDDYLCDDFLYDEDDEDYNEETDDWDE